MKASTEKKSDHETDPQLQYPLITMSLTMTNDNWNYMDLEYDFRTFIKQSSSTTVTSRSPTKVSSIAIKH